jgi:tubulin-folding cofactor B
VKSFLEHKKRGKYNAEEMKRKEEAKRQEMEADEIAAKAIKLGDRFEVRVPGQPVRIATVKYVGTVDFSKGWWIGVRYDEPLGKNDGMVDGKRYFECYPKYGGLVKPIYVIVGDFPEETLEYRRSALKLQKEMQTERLWKFKQRAKHIS